MQLAQNRVLCGNYSKAEQVRIVEDAISCVGAAEVIGRTRLSIMALLMEISGGRGVSPCILLVVEGC